MVEEIRLERVFFYRKMFSGALGLFEKHVRVKKIKHPIKEKEKRKQDLSTSIVVIDIIMYNIMSLIKIEIK
jgi:hypothetical protein